MATARKKRADVPLNLVSETELVSRVKQGEHEAFEELERRYRARVMNQIRRLCQDPEDVADVYQDVMTTLFLKMDGFEWRSQLSTWIYRIAFNAFLMHQRRRRHDKLLVADQDVNEISANENEQHNMFATQPFSHVFRSELRSELSRALHELPAGYREVFFSLSHEDSPLKEVSRRMGISIPALKSRQYRARQFLRSRLESVALEMGNA